MVERAVQLNKVKRPGGVFEFEMLAAEEDAAGVWLWYPTGSLWRAPHDAGTMPFDALLLVSTEVPAVTWWVDDPSDRRIEIDICLAPMATESGWSFIDLELDPLRHEHTGVIEIEDHDEFAAACQQGWISPDEAAFALEMATRLERALGQRLEPWGDEGWTRLQTAKSQG